VFFGAKREEFALTPDDEPVELGESRENWQLEDRAQPGRQRAESRRTSAVEMQWGGFFRRALAFLLDLVIVVVLFFAMGLLCYFGYKVGLSAHGRSVTLQNSTPLFFFLAWAWAGLVLFYFVLFHGMEGKTIGKRMLGLRVVGAERRMVTYRQAFLRSLATIVAFAPFGLGILWILWSRQKRGWHDFLARTWVVRD
jgi:uncharacterized RDD family membrane protein YckC